MRANALLLSMLLLAGGQAPLAGQTTGQIEGVVRDAAELPTPEAVLSIVETGTGAERRVSTDQRGWYLAPELAPGFYQIEVSRAGFRTEVRRGVVLAAGRTVRLDFLLRLGEARDSVVVVGEAPPISAAPSDWGGVIEQKKLESLPLNGRDLFDLSAQQPGATVTTTAYKTMATGTGIRVSVNGARPNSNSFRMDGIYINDATATAPSSAAGRLLGLESVQELQLLSSPFDAEYGRGGGAAFVAVSKSGSNLWNGDAYEYLRNSAFDTKNFFDPADEKIPPLRKNQFGGLWSGPLRRNRLFFLTNYEGVRLASGRTLSSVTPTKEARLGHLPGLTVAVAPEVVPYLDLYPLPNGRDYGDGTGEFITQGVTSSREDYVTGKVDVVFSNRLRHAARYTFDDAVTHRPDPLRVFSFLDDSRYHFLHTDTQFLQSPSTIHSYRAGFSRVWNRQTSSQPASIPASMSFVPGQPMGALSMTAGLSNLGGVTGDSITLMPRRFVINDFQFNYTLTHVRGAHTLRLGGAFDRVQFNQRADRFAKGSYTFSSLADFLQARPRSGDVLLPGSDSVRGWRQNIFSAFVQDEFRASPRLSVTLGVRYETYSTPTEVSGKIATIPDFLHDSTVTLGGPLFDNPSKINFAPRASVAVLPFGSGKTVIRAGGGIFFDLISTRELVVAGVRVPPYFNAVSVAAASFPNLLQAARNAAPTNSLDMLDYHLPQPYTAQYQFLVQQELDRDTVLQFGYSGSRGIHLPAQLAEANPSRPEVLSDGSLFFPANAVRLNPAFGRTRMRRTQFDSSYHGFQAGLQRKWQGGFRLQVKYVWSKSLDNTSNAINKDFLNSDGIPTMFNYRLNRGRSDFDLRHTFGGNFSWALPRGKGVPAGKVLGGWEIHGLIQAQTGPPFNPTVGFDRARLSGGGSGDVGERPVYVGAAGAKVILGDPRRWFDPSVFALPPAGMYGNLGRNTLNGPALVTLDLALHKTLWSTERQTVQLRLEAFNVANHPNFQIPSALGLFDSTSARVGSAGEITDTTTTSRQIQLALKWTF
jgi:hypothetical protein